MACWLARRTASRVLEALCEPKMQRGMLRSAESAVRTLSGEELTRLADYAGQAQQELAGGAQTITISVVTLLLIIIIIILLAD